MKKESKKVSRKKSIPAHRRKVQSEYAAKQVAATKIKKTTLKKRSATSKQSFVWAFAAEIGKIYISRQGVHLIVKKITPHGVQVVPEFTTKIMILKRRSEIFPCNRKKLRAKTLLHFKSCVEGWKGESILTSASETAPNASPAIVNDFQAQALPPIQTPNLTQNNRGPKGPRSLSVTSVVDPMLFSGLYTRQQINVALGASEIGKTLSNRDMGWYTAYRISVLKEKGYVLEKLDNDILKVSRLVMERAKPILLEPTINTENLLKV